MIHWSGAASRPEAVVGQHGLTTAGSVLGQRFAGTAFLLCAPLGATKITSSAGAAHSCTPPASPQRVTVSSPRDVSASVPNAHGVEWPSLGPPTKNVAALLRGSPVHLTRSQIRRPARASEARSRCRHITPIPPASPLERGPAFPLRLLLRTVSESESDSDLCVNVAPKAPALGRPPRPPRRPLGSRSIRPGLSSPIL